jgi:three-Cys-motif partner protein
LPKTKREAKDYLKDMLLQFDQTRSGRVQESEKYLKSLLQNSTETNPRGNPATDYGAWTLMKHVFLFEYLKPFFEIGSKHFRRLVFVDMFAGPGVNAIELGSKEFVTPGSPLIAYAYTHRFVRIERQERFDAYYFLERNKRKAKALKTRLEKLKMDFNLEEDPIVLHADSISNIWKIINDETQRLNDPKKTIARSSAGLLFLIFVDPEGLGMTFDALVDLVKRYVTSEEGTNKQHYFTADVIYTAPTHWVKQSRRPEDIQLYLGPKAKFEFSDDELAVCMADSIKEEVGGKCFVHVLPVRNAKNSVLYHIFFITKSLGASRAAQEVKRSLALKSKDLQNSLDALLGGASTIDDYWKPAGMESVQ